MSKPKQPVAARVVTERLRGEAPSILVVFSEWKVTFSRRDSATQHRTQRIATVGVWIKLDQLRELAIRAVENKSQHSRDGALNVEVHYVQEVKNV